MMTSSEIAPQSATQTSNSGYVDWGFAKATGRRLVAAGPKVTPAQAAQVVNALRSAAERSRGPVAETARMHSPAGSSSVLIVDRPGWIDANVDSLQSMLEPVVAAMLAKRRTSAQPPSNLVQDVGGKVTGAEAGALMSFLASKILGQYDLAPDATPGCCWWRPTCSRSSRRSASTLLTSGSGSACTRRRTACSSPPCRGCANT